MILSSAMTGRGVSRTTCCGASMVLLLVAGVSSAAETFTISLDLSDPGHNLSTTRPTTGPQVVPRQLMESAIDSPLVARWKVTCVGTEPVKDVVVHFYVVRIDRLGQAPPALNPASVLVESAVLMDFDPKSGSSAEIPFRVQNAGKYLIWIEATLQAGKETREEHATAELIVK